MPQLWLLCLPMPSLCGARLQPRTWREIASGKRTLMVANVAAGGRVPRSRSRIARVISACAIDEVRAVMNTAGSLQARSR